MLTERLELQRPTSQLVHNIRNFLHLLYHRKNIVFLVMVVSACLSGLYYATAVRVYRSEASLLVRQLGGDELVSSVSAGAHVRTLMPTHEQLIGSAVVLDRAIRSLPTEHRIDFKQVPKESWVNKITKNLSVRAARNTNIIDVTYRSQDPQTAVVVIHAVIQAYLEFVEQTHKGAATEVLRVLSREKEKLEAKLIEKESKLLAFRRKFGDLGIKAGGQVVHPFVQRTIQLNEAMVEAQEERIGRQASLAAVEAAVRNGEDLQQHVLAVEASVGREILLAGLGFNTRDGQVRANQERSLLEDRAELESLQQHYGRAHPRFAEVAERIRMTKEYLLTYQKKIQSRLLEIRDSQLGPMLTEMMRQALTQSWQRENALRASFEQSRQEAVSLNDHLAQLEILEHDVKRLRGFHDVMVSQIANTDLKQEHGDVRATVIKEPIASQAPVSPRLFLVLGTCLVGGLLASSTVIYVMDTLDDHFHSPEELNQRLGVPVLAIVRELKEPDQKGFSGVQVHKLPNSVESEAFRTLRTALAFSGEGAERIVMSSSEPEDGKTTVLINLAVSFAQSGKKTLLIDADLRRPGLTSRLKMKRTRGLSDVLRGEQEVGEMACECVVTSDVGDLDVLSTGPRPPNPSELLSMGRMSEFLVWAESRYDQILIDTPPVLATSDAQILGRLVDGVILVVSVEKNSRRVVSRALTSFAAVNVNLLGVVANRVSSKAVGYGYDYGYSYEYGTNQEESIESEDPDVVEQKPFYVKQFRLSRENDSAGRHSGVRGNV